ncbi:DUF374 domain-containing protein [Desulfopila sp. IMCC35006]|uniref:lysophospholipid acyltransferase family protein n=1 Tax=Desulfopila sp. IMCC35006 TaxID=2569542 RepID=UPI0010AC3811|nr:DUF374 domain-containing protein [Desulfopila sp. IMCC35006]TKB27441.1 DUF374 domain-containing protein [Desulfopila sp. IMCC35006]
MSRQPRTWPKVSSVAADGIAAVFAVLLRLAKASWRLEMTGLDIIRQALDRKERLLIAFWHGKHVALFPLVEGYDACVLTSRSFRGEVIAGLCRRFGYHCIILDHQHGSALQELLDDLLQTHRCLAIAVDGPLGPYHLARFGLVRLASHLQLLVVPLSMAARHKLIMKKRWDKMEFPLPFSRVLLGVGEPFRIPAEVQPDELGNWTDKVQAHIDNTDYLLEKLLL